MSHFCQHKIKYPVCIFKANESSILSWFVPSNDVNVVQESCDPDDKLMSTRNESINKTSLT